MKKVFYIGGILLAGLLVAFWPKTSATVGASALTPTITQVQPSQITLPTVQSVYIVIEGDNWPDESNGLTAQLVNQTNGNKINLDTFSYTPLSHRMLAEIPYWWSYQPATYNVVVMTRNGITGELTSGFRVIETDTSTPSSVGGDENSNTPSATPPSQTPNRPTVESIASIGAPIVRNYTPDVLTTGNGGMMIITGTDWPSQMYGIEVYLQNPQNWSVVRTNTFSYIPQESRITVEIPTLSAPAGTSYNVVVSKINGERTVITNGLWITS